MSEDLFPKPCSGIVAVSKSKVSLVEPFVEEAKVEVKQQDGKFTVVVTPKGKSSVTFRDTQVQESTLRQIAEEPRFLVGLLQSGVQEFLCGVLLKPSRIADTPTGVWTAEVERK